MSAGTLNLISVNLPALISNPWQPRLGMDAAELSALARSIEEQGLLQPIVVQAIDATRFVIVAGHRRVEAFRQLAAQDGKRWERIPAILQSGLDERQFATIAYAENVARASLSPVEEGAALQKMVEAGLAATNEELADLVQQPVARIKRLRRLAAGPRLIRDAADSGFKVAVGQHEDGSERTELRRLEFNAALAFIRLHEHYKVLVPRKADERTERAIRRALAGNWSVRRCETFIEDSIEGRESEPATETAKVLAALFTETKKRFVVDLETAAQASPEQLSELRAALERRLAELQGQR